MGGNNTRRRQHLRSCRESNHVGDPSPETLSQAKGFDFASDWEHRVTNLVQKHFGFSSLKGFQKEALASWVAHKDSLVLAATGSGKSLCFQIPALLSGKVVVVISPLISLMQDQCLKLIGNGISACFLGSAQLDGTVEHKAMRGMYSLIYVCPETLPRLIEPLQKLAENRGIALFAIDEAHCISRWGHDFRPAYSRLSMLRENFSSSKLKSLKVDIPLMALTATATKRVREDILESLCMSKETNVILTSFFQPNLRFMVKHSRTSRTSYAKDFHELIEIYGRKESIQGHEEEFILDDSDDIPKNSNDSSASDTDSVSSYDVDNDQYDYACKDVNVMHSESTLEQGPTIIYVPTRKETLRITEYLCKFGVKAAAYNAGLPQLDRKSVHENNLEVVVATIAFGMGIDKSNVRRLIHYGWPQSLEAYFQEAGRAGRDGKLADCILYANLASKPSLLQSRRKLSEDLVKRAYIMLSNCFRYGMNISCCRAKTLVEYFGEDFSHQKCLLCDVCINGPPQKQILKEDACIFLQTLAAHNACSNSKDCSYDDGIHFDSKDRRTRERPRLKMLVAKIRQQFPKFLTTDILWWRGLVRILEVKGYLKEGDDKTRVQIKYPEPTEMGLEFVKSMSEQAFYVHPEADMLLAKKTKKPSSSFLEWEKGSADPVNHRQHLDRMQLKRKPRMLPSTKRKQKRKANKMQPDVRTCQGCTTEESKKEKQGKDPLEGLGGPMTRSKVRRAKLALGTW